MVFHKCIRLILTVPHPVCFNISSISGVYSFNFIGMVLDVNFKFKEHVIDVTKNLSKIVPIIWRIRKCLSRTLMMQVYFGPIYPNLIYCLTVWGASNKNFTYPLQISENKFVHIVVLFDWISQDHCSIHWKK